MSYNQVGIAQSIVNGKNYSYNFELFTEVTFSHDSEVFTIIDNGVHNQGLGVKLLGETEWKVIRKLKDV